MTATTGTPAARARSCTCFVTALVAWAIWAAAFLALYAILLLAHVDPAPQLPREMGWWYFPVTLLGTWLGLTLMATIGQAGRPMLLAILFFCVPALDIL